MKMGFSLIELMMALTLIGILGLISYPLYNEHTIKVRRVYMETILLEVAVRMEKYHLLYNTYDGANETNLSIDKSRYNKYYKLDIQSKEELYTLKATPIGKQEKDISCGSLMLDQNGNKNASGDVRCWL